MQWSDVTKAPPPKMLRQFAGLCLVVLGGMAAWRYFQGQLGVFTYALAAVAVVVGVAGLVWPPLVRPVFIGWMVAAFPIGWVVSRLILAAMFYLVFTPVALVFRLMGRDALHLRRGVAASYWTAKPRTGAPEQYLRQF